MATAADLINSTLRGIGVIASGETPSAAEQSDALDALNDILEIWSNDGFMIFEDVKEEFTLVPSTQSYLIGTGATFDTPRPVMVRAAKLKRSGQNYETPISILAHQEWEQITDRLRTGEYPQQLYYNPTFPSGTINIYPTPSAAHTLVLFSLKPLTAITSTATTLSFPPGYKKALKDELKLELAEEFGKPITQRMMDAAKESKLGIQRTNTEAVMLISDFAGITSFSKYDFLGGK